MKTPTCPDCHWQYADTMTVLFEGKPRILTWDEVILLHGKDFITVCPGCHEPYVWKDNGLARFTTLGKLSKDMRRKVSRIKLMTLVAKAPYPPKDIRQN